MATKKKTPEELASEHWDWLQTVILQQVGFAGKMYRDAFVHGYKHGKEDSDKK